MARGQYPSSKRFFIYLFFCEDNWNRRLKKSSNECLWKSRAVLILHVKQEQHSAGCSIATRQNKNTSQRDGCLSRKVACSSRRIGKHGQKLSNKTFKLQENQGRALHSVWRHSAFSIGCQYVFRCECDAAHLENAGSQQKREAWDVKGKKINDEFYIFLIFLLELCGPNFATSHTGTEHIRRCITGLSKSTKARNQSRGYPTWPVTRMRTSRIEFSCFVFLTLIKKKKVSVWSNIGFRISHPHNSLLSLHIHVYVKQESGQAHAHANFAWLPQRSTALALDNWSNW